MLRLVRGVSTFERNEPLGGCPRKLRFDVEEAKRLAARQSRIRSASSDKVTVEQGPHQCLLLRALKCLVDLHLLQFMYLDGQLRENNVRRSSRYERSRRTLRSLRVSVSSIAAADVAQDFVALGVSVEVWSEISMAVLACVQAGG